MRLRYDLRDRASFLLALALAACSGKDDSPDPLPAEPACGSNCPAEEPLPTGGQSFDDGSDPPLPCELGQRLVDDRCEPLGEAGAACTSGTEDCQSGFCRFDATDCTDESCSQLRSAGVCGVPGQVGEACVPFHDQCAEGLECSVNRLCVSPGTVGAPCQAPTQCEGALVCRSHPNGRACGPSSGLGEACNAYGDCAAGLVCYDEGGCDEPGRTSAGVTCQDDPECASGLICNTVSLRQDVKPTCSAPNPLGGGCLRDQECEASLLCIGNQCRTLGDIGGACAEDGDCTASLNCNLGDPARESDSMGVCRELAPAGMPCAETADCEAGLACQTPEDPGPSEGGSCVAN